MNFFIEVILEDYLRARVSAHVDIIIVPYKLQIFNLFCLNGHDFPLLHPFIEYKKQTFLRKSGPISQLSHFFANKDAKAQFGLGVKYLVKFYLRQQRSRC